VTRNDMIQSFIEHGLTQAEVADESLLQILAGSDTSGTVMRTAIIYITSNPSIYQRLQDEVMAVDVPTNEIISHARALELPYLNACIKETLRYYPVNGGILPKTVGPEGDTHKGVYLPPGTDVGICAWTVFRHNPIYGPDYAYYRPERWLESAPEQLVAMEKEVDLTFMYGRFRCLGERIARIELLKSLFELFRRFDFALLNPMQPLQKEENLGVIMQRGLMVRVENVHSKGARM
jgi:cytochrome P450